KVSIEAGPKGAALLITADKDFTTPATVDVKVLSTATSLIAVRLEGAEYGLGVHRFTELPQETPIAELSAREREDYGVVDVVAEAHLAPDNPLPVKTKGNRVVVLLSREPFPSVSWRAPAPVLRSSVASSVDEPQAEWSEPEHDEAVPLANSEPQPRDESPQPEPLVSAEPAESPPENNEPAAVPQQESSPEQEPDEIVRLERVQAMQRGSVALLRFEFSGASMPKTRREDGRVVLLFPRAANGVGEHRLEPPGELFFRSLELRQRSRNETQWLGVIVTLDDADAAVYVHTRENSTTLTTTPVGRERFACWSSDRDTYTLAAFTDLDDRPAPSAQPESPPPQLASEEPISDRAVEDQPEAEPETPEVATPEPQADTQSEAVAIEPEEPDGYLVVVGDNVNVRSSANTDDGDNVVGSLERGMTVALLEERGEWMRVRTPSAEVGWVFGALLSARTDEPAEEEKAVLAAQDAPEMAPAKPKAASMFPVEAMGALTGIGANEPQANPVGPSATPTAPISTAMSRAGSVPEAAPPLPNVVQYTTYGRDPFVPYSRKIDEGFPSVENLRLVGILYDRTDRIALLQDELFEDKSYAMREQDQVSNGTVWRINPTNVIFLITELGISRTYTLELPSVSPTSVQEKRGKS
ncbi:MAG: SH3 domain-containing protein, partial [Chitinivibrionales bacterium]|nr:SH3 domain-containing protein [Chitinivibrionales bacterium]